MYKVAKIGALVLGVLSVILWVLLSLSDSQNDVDSTPLFGLFFLTYLLLAICGLAVLVSGAINILSNPKALRKTLIYTGAFLVIVGLSYVFAGGKDTTEKLVSTGLILFYILAIVAVGALVFANVKRALLK